MTVRIRQLQHLKPENMCISLGTIENPPTQGFGRNKLEKRLSWETHQNVSGTKNFQCIGVMYD